MTGRPYLYAEFVPIARFESALRKSGLLSVEQLAGPAFDPRTLPADGRCLAARLVEDGLLTPYQADRLLTDRPEGLVLGKYRVLAPLGAGGMGDVFLAEHTLLRRRVALKILAEHLTPDPAATARFRWEVQVAAQLAHPNIVVVHDAGEADGLLYLVMEYVDGVDLDRLVRERGPLPVELACECVRQAAMGLQHAHAAGFVHCDIKPSNFLLTRNTESGTSDWAAGSPYLTPQSEFRTLKIGDLGLARRLRPAREGVAPAGQPSGQEHLAGSADYLAPEQALDPGRVDARSDLYGLGCTFYYLLTGRAPFAGGAWPDKLLRHQLDQPTPVRGLRQDVPAEIEAVVMRLMSKVPADRYAMPAEVAVVLHEWLARRRDVAAWPRPVPTPKTPASLHALTVADLGAEAKPARASANSCNGAREVHERAHRTSVPPRQAKEPSAAVTRKPSRWLLPMGFAILFGLAAAGLLHYAPWRPPAAVSWPAAPDQAATVTVASQPGATFATLYAAIASARDGDTVTLHGAGPFLTAPVTLRGKALTLQADGPRARVLLAGPAQAWATLLHSDRPLRLNNIELAVAGMGQTRPAAAALHLLYSEGAPLALTDCRLVGGGAGGLIVARHAASVELERCEIMSHGSAVLAEVGPAPLALRVTACQLHCAQPTGAALTVWAPAGTEPTGVRVTLVGNAVRAGRVAAFSGLPQRIEVSASDNTFAFREALLSFAGCMGADSWRTATRWQGHNNRYRPFADWLTVEGRSIGVRGLEDWRGLWRNSETGSVEDPTQVAERTEK